MDILVERIGYKLELSEIEEIAGEIVEAVTDHILSGLRGE